MVVKVYLNDDANIPDSVKVNAGLPNNGRSWTVSVFVLKKKSVPELPDEEAVVTQGPLHPMPVQAPRWTGPGPPGRSDASPAGSQADNATDVKLEDATAEGIEPAVRVEEVEVANQGIQLPEKIVAIEIQPIQMQITSEVQLPSGLPKPVLKSVVISADAPGSSTT